MHGRAIIRAANQPQATMTEPVRSAQLSLLDHDAMQWQHVSGFSLRVRESRRARRLILHVVSPGVLEVVVPRGVRPSVVEAFVRDNRAWIEAARRELGSELPQDSHRSLPESVDLKAVGRMIGVRYDGAGKRGVRADGAERIVVGHGRNDAVAASLLRKWLLAEGRSVLKPWLEAEARRLGVTFAGVQVRLQRTRWGSCSSQRRISLNAALLLVEPELVRYLFVHELCHLTHMNHSPRYWARVSRFEPDYERADRRLGEAWKSLPAWLFAGRGVPA